MKNINQFLEKEKWEIRTLGEIASEIFVGKGVTEKQLQTGDFPAVKNKDIGKFPHYFCECRSFINPDLIKNKKYCKCGDLLISSMGGIKSVGKGCVYLGDQQCIIGNDIIAVRHNENPKFLAYVISTSSYKKQINKLTTGTTVYHLSPNKVKQIKIPLPPRHIQDLISNYMDTLNVHLSDLDRNSQELVKTRASQYSFYAEKLLSRSNS